MNKEEIQREIDSISADRDALERTRNKLTGDIALLLQQIAEAEKPKLRHGDFGIEVVEGTSYQRLITNPANETGLNISNKYGEIPPGHKITTVFGNVFDLLKEWSEDFNRYEEVIMDSADGCDMVIIEPSARSKDKIFVGSMLRGQRQLGIHLSESELQGFWMVLGTALFTLKRKQSLT